MAAYSANMRNLLDGLKSTLLLYQNSTLSLLKTWQKSVLPPVAVYPALSLMPVNETFNYGMSNSKYDVTRNISVQVFDLKYDLEAAHDNTIDLIKAIKDIFEDNYTLSGTTYSTKWSVENFGNTIEIGKKWLKRSSLTLSATTRESYPALITTGTCSSNVNVKDLQDRILSTLLSNKVSYYNSVNTIIDSPIVPSPRLPAIFVGAGYKRRNQDSPNVDMSMVYVDIAVCTELFAKETALNYNLSIVEGVKDVLQINHQFEGYCEYSNIESIEYEPEQIADRKFMYKSIITLACKMREFL